VGYEPTIPVFERAKKSHALDRTAHVFGLSEDTLGKFNWNLHYRVYGVKVELGEDQFAANHALTELTSRFCSHYGDKPQGKGGGTTQYCVQRDALRNHRDLTSENSALHTNHAGYTVCIHTAHTQA
jgi:hypothetical protein